MKEITGDHIMQISFMLDKLKYQPPRRQLLDAETKEYEDDQTYYGRAFYEFFRIAHNIRDELDVLFESLCDKKFSQMTFTEMKSIFMDLLNNPEIKSFLDSVPKPGA